MMAMRFAVLGLLLVASCSGSRSGEIRGASSAEQLAKLIDQKCRRDAAEEKAVASCRENAARAHCEARDGSWVEFTSGCEDSCLSALAEAQGVQVYCTLNMPMGCDCGADQCWDGVACVDNPPPQPRPPMPHAALPTGCQRPAQRHQIDSAAHAGEAGAGFLRELQCNAAWAAKLLSDTRALGDHPAVLDAVQCLGDKVLNLKVLTDSMARRASLVAEAPNAEAAREEYQKLSIIHRRGIELVGEMPGCLERP